MSITSASAVLMMSVVGIYDSPQQLQRFSADDIFTNDPVQVAETAMGVDGYLSAGYVNNPVSWSVSLMADSPSNAFFDRWVQENRRAGDCYRCNGSIWLPALNQKFNMNNGALTTQRYMPDAAKTLRSRTFVIVWESITPAIIQ